jgi:ankyrin repeat protein
MDQIKIFLKACIKGDLKLIREHLDSGFDVETRFFENNLDVDGITPLYIATEHKQLEVVKLLVSYGALVDNPSTCIKMTPLLLSIIQGSYEIASFLINEGAEPHLGIQGGLTPLKRLRATKKGVNHALHREKCDELLLLIEKLYGGGINTKSCE